jgi:segregation and condensation protein B
MEVNRIKQIIEAALMAAGEPLNVERLVRLFKRGEISMDELRQAVRQSLEELALDCAGRGFELVQVASGYRYQVRQELSEWVSRLWEEKPGKYSRAFLEILSLIAYKQPVTRGDIELVRGVAVSPNIIRTLMERGWIRVVGTRDVPGRPSLYGTTREFLDYFNLQSLDQMPPLAEIRSLLEHDAPEDPDDPLLNEGGVSVELPMPDEIDEALAGLSDADAEPANGEDPTDNQITDNHTNNVVRLPSAGA